MCNLFSNKGTIDRQATQLAYALKFYPWQAVPEAGKKLIAWRRAVFLTKDRIESLLDPEMLTISHKGYVYPIVWAYNNIPTEQEWKRKSDNFLIFADFRGSPVFKEGAVVILDFRLPSTKLGIQ